MQTNPSSFATTRLDPSGSHRRADWTTCTLEVHAPGDEPTEFCLEGERICVGRSSKADLRLRHASVSRNHAVLTGVDKGYEILPVHEDKPVVVNGTAVTEPVLLRDGDTVQLGAVVLMVRRAWIDLAERPKPHEVGRYQQWDGNETLQVSADTMHRLRAAVLSKHRGVLEPVGEGELVHPPRDGSKLVFGGRGGVSVRGWMVPWALAEMRHGTDGHSLRHTSRFGTVRVNDVPVEAPVVLRAGDRVTLGSVRFIYRYT